ncbi:hypothetical protein Dthio_PD0390 [Desulfonatronospira thiodismutans ASO3-1]|uniref:Lipoprotein n=1 Tax=Desulfonatronospira thiodismutans ASO3-1 TaxID=555779 RepID=D6SUU6_9BACT|nr:hypothetical protein [Desulfonatronospira thiodismutans]EFI33076.1 hypothetical protein Dthio_PD0390 [Desulfonatronospira thiodismutans ASO3-1]
MKPAHFLVYLLFAFLLAGCAAGYKAPGPGQLLPDYDPKLFGYEIHEQWMMEDGREVILAENTFLFASDEYVLRIGRARDRGLLELKLNEIHRAKMYKLDDFYVYEGIGRHSEDCRWVVEIVRIRENRAHRNIVEIGEDRRKLITRNDDGDRLILAVMARDLDDSEFWGIEQRRVRNLAPNRMDWEHLEYFQVQAARAFQEADKGKHEQQARQAVEMQRVEGMAPEGTVEEPEDDGRVIIDLGD